jgi:hypothetical protein
VKLLRPILRMTSSPFRLAVDRAQLVTVASIAPASPGLLEQPNEAIAPMLALAPEPTLD